MVSKLNPRHGDIDIIKAVAVFCIICIHASVGAYGNPIGSFDWVSGVLWGSLTRAGVPLFLMCSGALMLNPEKEMSLKKLYSKNLLRLLAALFSWAFAYKCYNLLIAGSFSGAALWQAVKEILLFNHQSHLYYMHIMLLVYAFLPVTRVFVKHAKEAQLRYFLIVWFVLGILYPSVRTFWPFNLLTGIPTQWLINMTYASIGYGVLGWYIKKHPPKRAVSALFAALGFAIVFGGTWIMSARRGELYEGFFEGMSVGVCLLGAGIFGLLIGLSPKKLLTFASKASFCTYLSHIFFLNIFYSLGFTAAILPCIVSIPLITAAALICGTVLYCVLSHIPIVKDWLI